MASHHPAWSPVAFDDEAPLPPNRRYPVDVPLKTVGTRAKMLDYGCGKARGMRGVARLARMRILSWVSRSITFRLAATVLLTAWPRRVQAPSNWRRPGGRRCRN
jgi:hypothetical protein